MKTHDFRTWFGLGLLAVLIASIAAVQAGDAPPAGKESVYDESADGSRQIADALALAGKDGKRVLLQFGANWCPWCHKLHALFKSDKEIAARLKRDYVVVLIDVNKGHNAVVDAKYGHPTQPGQSDGFSRKVVAQEPKLKKPGFTWRRIIFAAPGERRIPPAIPRLGGGVFHGLALASRADRIANGGA